MQSFFKYKAPEKSSSTIFCALIEVDKNQKECPRLNFWLIFVWSVYIMVFSNLT